MRELSERDTAFQAEALLDYLRRGGARPNWLESKGFTREDVMAILRAVQKLGAFDVGRSDG